MDAAIVKLYFCSRHTHTHSKASVSSHLRPDKLQCYHLGGELCKKYTWHREKQQTKVYVKTLHPRTSLWYLYCCARVVEQVLDHGNPRALGRYNLAAWQHCTFRRKENTNERLQLNPCIDQRGTQNCFTLFHTHFTPTSRHYSLQKQST